MTAYSLIAARLNVHLASGEEICEESIQFKTIKNMKTVISLRVLLLKHFLM